MIYSKMIKKAMRVAVNAHAGQVDRGGYPYILHPLHLAESMSDEKTTIVALLHDVIEDTAITMAQLKEYGFDKEVLVALQLLTHDTDTSYDDYIQTIASNHIAKTVKLADLKHNSDLSRLSKTTDNDIKRVEKYQKSIYKLEQDSSAKL